MFWFSGSGFSRFRTNFATNFHNIDYAKTRDKGFSIFSIFSSV